MIDIHENDINEFYDRLSKFIGVPGEVTVVDILEWFNAIKFSSLNLEDFSELFNIFFNGCNDKYTQNIKECFEYFDKDKDQLLNFEEFQELCLGLFEPFLSPKSAFIIVDVQNDFINGSLALKNCPANEDGAEVIPMINSILTRFIEGDYKFKSVVYTYDWHPKDHISFFDNIHCRRISQHSPISLIDVKPLDKVIFETDSGEETDQILWPKHCVENSDGAALHKDLMVIDGAYHLKKGIFSNVDSYSAFGLNHPKAVTDLNNHLKSHDINFLFVCGLATDVCVAQTALDGLSLGYRVALVKDACRGVNQENIDNVQCKLIENHAIIISSAMISHILNGRVKPVQLAVSLIKRITNK